MILFLSETDVASVLSMGDCIRVLETAFLEHAHGETLLLPRFSQTLPGTAGSFRAMSAAFPKLSRYGLKTLTGFPGRRLQDEVYFAILLFDMASGALRAVISANYLTGLRTGAATGVAAKYLARDSAATLGVFGAGAQARYQVEALCAVRSVSRVNVFAPDIRKATAFAAELSDWLPVDALAVVSRREAVQGCDLVVTATTATEPVFDGEWIEEGTHVSGVGSNTPGKCELDGVCFKRSRIVVDYLEQAIHEAGDLHRALQTGAILPADVSVDLSGVLSGTAAGRTNDLQITLFKSVGMAIEDIAPAAFVYDRALRLGIGTQLDAFAAAGSASVNG